MFKWLAILLIFGFTAGLLAGLPKDLHGFADVRAGLRTGEDETQKDESLAEARLQLDYNYLGNLFEVRLRADLLYDDVVDDRDIDLEQGKGWLDLREANILFSPTQSMDVKLGRQILTWGAGDLLFINDLFPKDWQSFFNGRDVEYLKAPSDAVFMSFFPSFANIDLVYTPRFDADRHLTGERLSLWNPLTQSITGSDDVIDPVRPDDWIEDGEFALRISKTVGALELGFYGYDGFWKSPAGFDPQMGRPTFNPLRVFGASVRGTLGKALVAAEAGYYDSRDSQNGTNPFAPNSEFRLLLAYERELAQNLTGGFQYYLEYMDNYGAYEQRQPPAAPLRDQARHVLTMRLTRLALNQNLTLSLFTYWSPSDEDGYLRPGVKYKLNDDWLLTAGGNLFFGAEDHTFFGQFENNNNLYAGARYSF